MAAQLFSFGSVTETTKTKYKLEKLHSILLKLLGFRLDRKQNRNLGCMQNPGLKAEKGDENLLHIRNEVSEKNSVKLERNNWKLTEEHLVLMK